MLCTRPVKVTAAGGRRQCGRAWCCRRYHGVRDGSGAVQLWDASLGTRLAAFRAHAADVLALAAAPDGSAVFAAGVDPQLVIIQRVPPQKGAIQWVLTKLIVVYISRWWFNSVSTCIFLLDATFCNEVEVTLVACAHLDMDFASMLQQSTCPAAGCGPDAIFVIYACMQASRSAGCWERPSGRTRTTCARSRLPM